jgi:hypothetical protein
VSNHPFKLDTAYESEILLQVHILEESRIAGPGSSKKDICDILWSLTDLQPLLPTNISLEDVKTVIGKMKLVNEILEISGEDDSESKYITRTAETIRLLGHTYEYWHQGRPGIDALRWIPERKMIPSRKINHGTFISRLCDEVTVLPEQLEDFEEAVNQVLNGIAELLGGGDKSKAGFSEFQYRATESALKSYFEPNSHASEVLTAGVGSGKTIGFILPVLILSRFDELCGISAIRLILYPRTALANDQFDTIQQYAEVANLQASAAHSEMKYNDAHPSVAQGVKNVHSSPPRPRIIVSTMETLKRRLQNPDFVQNVMPNLSHVVIDEVHLISGSQGSHVAHLMRRLQALSSKEVHWAASSATIANPEDHVSRIFNIDSKIVKIISPKSSELGFDGIQNHVFLRPSGLISNLGALVNITSLVMHSRRDNLSIRANTDRQIENTAKTIGFADNLDILGRWNSDLMENERTENRTANDGMERSHPSTSQPIEPEWTRMQREIPYAARFQKPLQRRMCSSGGVLPETKETALLPILQEHSEIASEICDKCKSGERISLGSADEQTMIELGKHVHRIEHHADDAFKPFLISHEIFQTAQDEIGTLDLCPFLRAGACTWFSKSEPNLVKMIDGTESNRKFEFAAVGRSTIHSSKSEKSEESAESLAAEVFRDKVSNVYQLQNENNKKVSVNIVLASPSLEVGIDIPNLTESVMIKSVRNIASYRQKAGRVGRGSFMDSLNATLITDSPVDLHYYRQPRKLVSEGRLEPIPLKERNIAVMQCAMYQSVWDWLAMFSSLPEVIPSRSWHTHGVSEFRIRLEKCSSDLLEHVSHLRTHIVSSTGDAIQLSDPLIDSVISQVSKEIGAFLLPANGTWTYSPPISGDYLLADVFIRRLSSTDLPQLNPLVKDDVIALLGPEGDWKNLKGKRGRLTRLETRNVLDTKFMRELDVFLSFAAPDLDKMNEMIGLFEVLKSELEGSNLRRVEEFSSALISVRNLLEDLLEDGWNPLCHSLQNEYAKITGWKRFYFSTIRSSLDSLKHYRENPWFVDPKTLFTNPYDTEVELVHSTLQPNQEKISVTEALHSFIPGNWTYRLPQSAYKVMCGILDYDPASSIANLDLEQASTMSSEYRKITDNISGPPGMPMGTSLSIYTPVRLQLRKVKRKYIDLNPEAGLLADNDELPFSQSGHRSKKRKIPRSFNNRWTHFSDEGGLPIVLKDPSLANLGSLKVTRNNGNGQIELSGEEAAREVLHPLFGHHLEEVRWHDVFEVTEFVYSSTRSYSTDAGYGKEIRFHDGLGHFALGQTFKTEGLSFDLNQETFGITVNQISSEMNAGAPCWTPTLVSIFSSYLEQLPINPPSSRTLGHFEVQDIMSILISLADDGNVPFTPKILFELLEADLDSDKVRRLATRRIKAKHGMDLESAPEGGLSEDDIKEAIERLEMNIRTAQEIVKNKITEFETEYLPLWLHRSILMSMGVTTVSALQQISGSQTSDIGYTIDSKSWNGESFSLHVYDRCHHGNGSSRVGKEFLHIPNILRHRLNQKSKLLPTTDFLSQIEEGLLQCMQHHSDMAALSLHESGGEPTPLSRALNDIASHAEETLSVASEHWESLGINSISDAWRIAQKFHIRKEIAANSEIALDDITRATRFCWNGCPECIDRLDIVLGGNYGMPYLDKAILDVWYRNGRAASRDYHDVKLEDLAAGIAPLQFGITHNVTLDIYERRLRSSLLPWTIGLDLQRSKPNAEIRMLIRESDILKHRSVEMNAGQDPIGIPSVGVKRLIWFDLILTAYLDAAGRLDSIPRCIDLVYYDIRDIEFEDVGLSPRMLDSVQHLGKEVGFSRFERLSDILAWLVHRGFTIRLCVDSQQSQQDGVDEFLKTLHRRSEGGDGTLNIRSKDIGYASMHKKILLTPIGGLMGSANLTDSGTARSEEINSHIPRASPNFQQLKTSCDDSFQHTQPWRSN